MNKKIGIVTQLSLLTFNYGNHLQAYALNRYLNTRFQGIVAETLLLKADTGLKYTSIHGAIDYWVLKLKKKIYRTLFCPQLAITRLEKFREFAGTNIIMSSEGLSYKELIHSDYDIYIVGSDVVWYQVPGVVDRCRFLDIKNNKVRYAYSASFGNASIPKENRKVIGTYLKKFDRISVRESAVVSILKQIGIENVIHTCDPTMLLDPSEWRTISKRPQIIMNSIVPEYVFAYFLGDSEKKIKVLKGICKRLGLRLFYIPYINGILKDTTDVGNVLMNCSPEEWIWLIDHAKYVITDSFHGIVFSILMKTNFLAVKRVYSEDINLRIIDLLEYIDAKDKLVLIEDIGEFENYSWDAVGYLDRLTGLINISKEYLQKIVSGK